MPIGGLIDLTPYAKRQSQFVLNIKGLKSTSRIRFRTFEHTDIWHDLISISGDGKYTIDNIKDKNIYEIKFQNGDIATKLSVSIHKATKKEKQTHPVKHGQRLIGALYYDGWSDKSIYGGTGSTSQALYETSGLPAKELYPDWREYVKAHDGYYPPKDCSFSMYYPQYAPSSYSNLPSRKPFWGWRRDTPEDIGQEIELASSYGIDYFMFCFYPRECFKDSDEVNEQALKQGYCNNAIYQFLKAPNKSKMKFCVMIENSGGIYNTAQMKNLIKYISRVFFSDSSYLHMNGAPVVGLYKWNFNNTDIDDSYKMNECKFISNAIVNSAEGRMWYAILNYSPYGMYPYQEAADYSDNSAIAYAKNKAQEIICMPVIAGRDDRARHDFTDGYNDHTYRFYQMPTKQEFYNSLVRAIDNASWATGEDQSVLIYAWNEFGEGGFLPPTYGDTTPQPNNYPVLINNVQIKDKEGKPLFFDFYKLEAVKQAKDYWNSTR